MAETRRLAAEYRRATGKALPVSGELAVHDAITLLSLQPAPADSAGYDAWRERDAGSQCIQIKGCVIFDDRKGGTGSGSYAWSRIGTYWYWCSWMGNTNHRKSTN
jgi:hypothetical protein